MEAESEAKTTTLIIISSYSMPGTKLNTFNAFSHLNS